MLNTNNKTENEFSRTELLLGKNAMQKLKTAHVAIFGIGGVGGFVCEALARSGISNFDLIDNDVVAITNLNRQIIALHSTLGMLKVDVMKSRILDINPTAQVNVFKCFFLPETSSLFDFSKYDYIVDAVDTVTAKMQLIVQAKKNCVPIISSMGAGNKLNPTMFEVSDIYKTSVCPLARVIRNECRKRGIKDLKVVYSKEAPILLQSAHSNETQKIAPGSIAFVPSVAGLIIASEVVKDLIQKGIP